MNESAIQGRIIDYLRADSFFCEFLPATFKASDSFKSINVFDSMSVLTLINFCENEFKIKFEALDITEEDFRSPESLAHLVLRKVKAGAAP